MMAGNRTLAIVKPDAFGAGKAGKILAHIEGAGFKIIAARVTHLSDAEAGEFYAVHKERPFFGSLTKFMTSGPCMPIVLEKSDAWIAFRSLLSANSFRIVFASASAGSVAPIVFRKDATASAFSRTTGMHGPDVMNFVSEPKNGRSLCTA